MMTTYLLRLVEHSISEASLKCILVEDVELYIREAFYRLLTVGCARENHPDEAGEDGFPRC